ncbi:MAG: hypothetical protein QM705_00280 [Ancrocorticia sp.]
MNNSLDERQKLNAGSAAIITLFLVGLGCFGYVVWDFIAHGDITNPTVLVIMLVTWGLFYLFYQVFGNEAPKTMLGRELETGPSSAERRNRRRSYLWDSLLSAVFLTGLTAAAMFVEPGVLDAVPVPLTGGALIVVSLAAEFLITALIFFAISYTMGEVASRSFERKMAKLEAGE